MTTNYAEHPDQAWQVALELLQMEMPRSSFNTWVRDTKALSYGGGLLTVGVQNAYARDWLEDRLRSTVSRLLIGMMGEHVGVDFVVIQAINDDDDNPSDEDSRNAAELNDKKKRTANIGNLAFQERYATLYQEEVKPNRVVTISGYLVRHVEQGDMAPSDALGAIAAKQIVWPAHSRTGQTKIKQNIPHDEFIRWANISRTSFFRKLKENETELFGGMVKRIPEQPNHTRSNRRLDNANFYLINISPPLTRRDSACLAHVLAIDVAEGHTEKERIKAAQAALFRLKQMASYAWLDEIDVDTSDEVPRELVKIVRKIVGIKGDMPAGLKQLAEELQDRIINKFGLIYIPHHFLLKTAPAKKLNAGQIWAIIVLRYLRYFDNETQERMDYLFANNGIAGLVKKLGTNVRSFKRWLATSNVDLFVAKADIEIEGAPEEKARLEKWLAKGGEVYLVRDEEPPLWYETVDGDLLPHWTWDETKMVLDDDKNETHLLQKRDSVITKMRLTPYKNETPLNKFLLKTQLSPFKSLQTNLQPEEAEADDNFTVARGGGWDLSTLLKLNPVSSEKLQERIQLSGDSEAFVSWLLYAYSLEGQGINSPAAFVVGRMGKNPKQGAKSVYQQIARLGPEGVRAQIVSKITGEFSDDPDTEAFRRIFRGISHTQLRELESCLFTNEIEN